MSNNATNVNATTPETTATTTFVIPSSTELREARKNFVTDNAKQLADTVLNRVAEFFSVPNQAELFSKMEKGYVRLYKAYKNSTIIKDAIFDPTHLNGLTGKLLDEVRNEACNMVQSALKEKEWAIGVEHESAEYNGVTYYVVLREI